MTDGSHLIARPAVKKTLLGLGTGKQILIALVLPLALAAIHPVADGISEMAVLAGFGTGLALNHRYVRFDVVGSPRQCALRFLTGAGGVMVLYLGLKMAFPSEGAPFYPWLRLLRYALVGVWVTFGAPWLFCRLRLAARQPVVARGSVPQGNPAGRGYGG